MSIAETPHSDCSCSSERSLNAIWHPSAPKQVRRLYVQGQASKGWEAWQEYCRDQVSSCGLTKLFPKGHRVLRWGLGSTDCAATISAIAETVESADDSVEPTLRRWLEDAEMAQMGPEYAVSTLAWCWALPELASIVSADVWWSLLHRLLDTAMEAMRETMKTDDSLSVRDPWSYQVLAGELPLTLAYLFPEITGCRALHTGACATLSAGLLDLLDGEGLPHALLLPQLHSLLACWTRSFAMARSMKRRCWNKEAQRQYRQLVGKAVRLARRDGSQVFSNKSNAASDLDLLATALKFGGSGKACGLAAAMLPDKKGRLGKAALPSKDGQKPQSPQVRSPKPKKGAIHSEWAATAVLRPDLSPSSPRLTVLFPGESCRTELACGKDVLWSGEWEFDVRIDGVSAKPTGEWQEVCWVSDADVDYLELQIELGEGLRIQRHMLLARQDNILFLADAVLGTRHAALQYRGTLPLCNGIRFRQPCETSEGTLVGRKRRASVMPLALSEWQVNRDRGELLQTATGLELRQSAEGRSLFAPLFLDLDRDRSAKPLTWRQLTVADLLRVQPADVAVGYRATAGGRHWLIYRALGEVRNRTLIGHNLSTEMLVARFGTDGEVETLLEIE